MSGKSYAGFNEFAAKNPELVRAAKAAIEKGQVPKLASHLPVDRLVDVLNKGRSTIESVDQGFAGQMEAIVRLTGRPPLLVAGDRVVLEPLSDFPLDIVGKIKTAEQYIPSVGRVEFINHDLRWGGTGWVVEKRSHNEAVVVTNRHVAQLVARRALDGSGVFLRSYVGALMGIIIDFNEEVGATPIKAREVRVRDVQYLADETEADVALVVVTLAEEAGFALPDAIPLLPRQVEDGELVALVGYPAYDSRNDLSAMARYFRDLYDVKRFAPGRIMKASVADAVLSHDCTSLGGNSGSVLLSLKENGAVGLHFAGQYGSHNSAVSAITLEKLRTGSRLLVPVKAIEASGAAEEAVHPVSIYNGRQGYVPEFLGGHAAVPWPTLPDDLKEELAKPSDATAERPHELKYTHFGVLLSAKKRLPVLTAVNIDGENALRIKRGKDKWYFDSRVRVSEQMGDPAYADRSVDRGHMVRREDPNWSVMKNAAEAQQANDDTFHFTNCAPQHSLLNQGKALWQGLENYILDSFRTHGFKACVFTAPIYREDDPPLDAGVRVPLEFWKLVVTRDAAGTGLHATAYLLSQGHLIRELIEKRRRTEAIEGFVLGPYRTFQISILDLAEATGFNFNGLEAYDPLRGAESGLEAVETSEPVFIPLSTAEDLVL